MDGNIPGKTNDIHAELEWISCLTMNVGQQGEQVRDPLLFVRTRAKHLTLPVCREISLLDGPMYDTEQVLGRHRKNTAFCPPPICLGDLPSHDHSHVGSARDR